MKKQELGFSLVEVMIAVVILSLVGGALLNGLISQENTSKKITVNTSAFSKLDAAVDLINATKFRACGPLPLNPYAGLLPSDVTVTVYALPRKSSSAWKPCGDAIWDTQPPSLMQRIELTTPYSSMGTIRRYILKTFSPKTDSYSFDVGPNPAQIVLGPLPGPNDASNPLTGSLSLTPSSSSYCFFPLYSDLYDLESPGFSPTLNSSCSYQLSVDARSATKPGSYDFDFGAIQVSGANAGQLGNPKTVTVLVKGPLSVATAVRVPVRGVLTSDYGCTAFNSSTATAYCEISLSRITNTGTLSGLQFDSTYTPAIIGSSNGSLTNSLINSAVISQSADAITLKVWKVNTTPATTTALCYSTGAYATNTKILIYLRDAGYTSRAFSVEVTVKCA